MAKTRKFFGEGEVVRIEFDGIARMDINISKMIDRAIDEAVPSEVPRGGIVVRMLKRRVREALLRDDVLTSQLGLLVLESPEMAGATLGLREERERNVKVAPGGPAEITREVIDHRARYLHQYFQKREAGQKRQYVSWQEIGPAFVQKVDELYPFWAAVARFYNAHQTVQGLHEAVAGQGFAVTQDDFPLDLLEDLIRRPQSKGTSTPLAIACEHAARHMNIESDVPGKGDGVPYTRLTLKRWYQKLSRQLGRKRTRGRRRKSDLSSPG